MANSPVVRRIVPFLAAGCAGLLGMSAAAQLPGGNEKIVLEAVPLDINTKNNTARLRDVVITQGATRIEAAEADVKGGLDFEDGTWTISGNVRITSEGGNLRSDKATVSFRGNLISRAIITGTPAQFEQTRKDGSIARGRASTMDYEIRTGTVSFRDNAWLSDGCNEITGPQLVYNIKSQSVAGGTRTAGTTGRIRITIQPNDANGKKPCTAPADPKP